MKKIIIVVLLLGAGKISAMDKAGEKSDKSTEQEFQEYPLFQYFPKVEQVVMRLSSLNPRDCQPDRVLAVIARLDSMVDTISGTSIAWRTLEAYKDGLMFAARMDNESIGQSLDDVKKRADTAKNSNRVIAETTDPMNKEQLRGALVDQRSLLLDEMGAQLARYLMRVEELDTQINKLK